VRLVNSLQGPFWVWDQDHLGQVLESNIYPQGWWDGHLKPFIDEVADPQKIAVDVGASVGWFSRYFASLFRWTISIEAHPGTYELLVKNTQGLPVECWNFAAYDRETTLELAPEHELGWPVPNGDLNQTPNASSVAFIPAPGGGIKAFPVDELLSNRTDIALIKLDTQGCDLRALMGLRQAISNSKPRIIFEYEAGASEWHGDTWADYLRFFEEIEYQEPLHVRDDVVDWVADPR